jgi:dihydroorotate dehydrogenase (NAD+) catalytic subunit
MGGISSWEDAVEFFMAGATAVAVGTGAFSNPHLISQITAGVKKFLYENNFSNIYEIIGIVNN